MKNLFPILILLLSASTLPAAAQQPGQKMTDGPFIHTVYFWLNNPDSPAEQQKLLEGLNMIKEIDLIRDGYVGVPAPTDREVIDSSYDFSITFIFDNMEDEQAYQTHSTHLKFVEEFGHLWGRVVVYDTVPPGRSR